MRTMNDVIDALEQEEITKRRKAAGIYTKDELAKLQGQKFSAWAADEIAPEAQAEFDRVFSITSDLVKDPHDGAHGGPKAWGFPFR